MNPLHPRVIPIWRLSGVFTVLVLTAVSAAIEAVVLAPEDIALLTPGALSLIVGASGLGFAILWPPLRYRHWRWSVHSDRVVIQRGVVWRTRSLIPRVRIQHVDTRSSPLQRWYGLSSLVIYTAGTRGADAEIPGLDAENAERLREELARLEELDERS